MDLNCGHAIVINDPIDCVFRKYVKLVHDALQAYFHRHK